MGKGKRLLAGSVLALAVSGIVAGAALAGWGPDTHGVASHTVAYDEHPVSNMTTNGRVSVSNPTAVEYGSQPAGETWG
jgi:hypothetical protein